MSEPRVRTFRTSRRKALRGLLAVPVAAAWSAAPSQRGTLSVFSRRYTAGDTLRHRLEGMASTKRDAGPLGWLAHNQEPGQTFEEYARLPDRLLPRNAALYIAPVGDFPAGRMAMVGITARFLGDFYGLPVKALDGVSLAHLPRGAQRRHPGTGGKQLHAGAINAHLVARGMPADAVGVIALTNEDLWPGGNWNFVLGLASLTQRVGVWSLARLGDPTRENVVSTRFLWRTIRTASHECGHLLGIRHCTMYECGMNGANGLWEFDTRPLEFCPECQAKVLFATGLNALERVRRLAAFAAEFGLRAERAQWSRMELSLLDTI